MTMQQTIENPLQALFNLAGLRELLLRPGAQSPGMMNALAHLEKAIEIMVLNIRVSGYAQTDGPSDLSVGNAGVQAGVGVETERNQGGN